MLSIRNLSVRIGTYQIVSIDEIDLNRGHRLGLVGESGSGKTMTAMSIVGLQPRDARVTGSVTFNGRELVGLGEGQLTAIRGAQIGVIFQDASQALNPTMRIGKQIAEAVRLQTDVSRAERRGRVLELLRQVQLPDPTRLARRYPHQLSGGQQQRVLIAMAIASRPALLIADEPTTALDATVQKGILELLLRLSEANNMAMLFVSHNLGVVRAVCDEVAVLYGGRLVESGLAPAVIDNPRHRYTEALIGANPGRAAPGDLAAMRGRPLGVIPGTVPALDAFPTGCPFRDRCQHRLKTCTEYPPATRIDHDHRYVCWNPKVAGSGEVDGADR